jgi:hypothetical protein
MEYYRLTIPIPKKPWLFVRFRIASILFLATILAILLAWKRDHDRMAAEIAKLRYPYPRYEAIEATGAPNVTTPGDSSSAWCPATMNSGSEWLQLDYDAPVVPTAVIVHENYGSGMIVRITHVPILGAETTLWEGGYTAAAGPAGAIATLPVTNGISTGRIKIYLDTSKATGWEEIDAVGLVDAKGKTHWAKGAKASSTWAQGSTIIQSTTLQPPRFYTVQPNVMIDLSGQD